MYPKHRLIIMQPLTTIMTLISFPPIQLVSFEGKKLMSCEDFHLLLSNKEDTGKNIISIFWKSNLKKH